MMDQLIRWSLGNRALVLLAALLLLLFGAFTASRMPVHVFPDLTAPTVTIITEAHGMALVGVVVVLGIALLLHLAFGSTRDALLVMLNLPLALIGGVAGVFASGSVLSVASVIGFITVFGIATRNGIMLVSHIRHLQEHEGVTDFREAVRRGALERLAPILMTVLAAELALIPLALAGGKSGNEIQTPLAMVILLGLLTSMLLNMLIVPALYLRFGRAVKLPTPATP